MDGISEKVNVGMNQLNPVRFGKHGREPHGLELAGQLQSGSIVARTNQFAQVEQNSFDVRAEESGRTSDFTEVFASSLNQRPRHFSCLGRIVGASLDVARASAV